MSSIGKLPIKIPAGVDVKLDGKKISVKGPKGELFWTVPALIKLKIDNEHIFVRPEQTNRQTARIWGLSRKIIANMVQGVNEEFVTKLLLEGVGYRAAMEGRKLVLKLGFTNSVEFQIPSGINISLDKKFIVVSGADKQAVGTIAAEIRASRPVEPYKGKGLMYEDEFVRRKAGKKAATGA